ncbi:MAG: PAS domain-containing sensor histidine kinase [Deltaproteobacteria bacterium]|nr:PAS domain-containing sensor histidine kinase [Deltaproteobacteria bacterium]
MASAHDDLAHAVFGLLFATGGEAAFVVARQSRRVELVNARLAEMLGVERDAITGANADELFVASEWLPGSAALDVAGYYEDVAMRREDGTPVYVTLTVAHVAHPELGELAACVARDATERRSLERELLSKHTALAVAHRDLEQTLAQLRHAHLALEERNHEIARLAGQVSRFGWRAAVGELAASVAHELNNPVGALLSTLRTIGTRVAKADDPALRAELEPLVKRCRDAAVRIEVNVGAVVKVHRSGPKDCAPRWIDLGRELDTALSLFQTRLAGVEVRRQYGHGVRAFVAEESLHHVFANLFDNALHATRGRGLVEVEVAERSTSWVIAVRDDGGGVPAAVLPRLFEPMVSARPGGAGLGLSTARSLARLWGGDVIHVPKEGGSCFEILVPAREAP